MVGSNHFRTFVKEQIFNRMKVYTRTSKKAGTTKLYIKPKFGKTPTWLNTGLDVSLTDWDKTFSLDADNNFIQSDVKVNNLMRKLGHDKKLQDIENGLRSLRDANNLNIDTANSLIETIVLADVRAEQEKQQERLQKAVDAQRKDVKRYIDNYINGLVGDEVQSLTKKQKEYKHNSIKIWGQFQRIFNDFYKTHKIATWDDMDKRYVEKFSTYLNKQYLPSTYVRLISCLRTITGRAFDDGVRTKQIPSDMFYRPTVHAQDKAAEIYLTNEELDALFNMELTGLKEQVRDLFLIGCYTGQRFSDYSAITKECVGTTAKGVPVLRLTQVKTGKSVVIPILNEKLVSLLEKYDYTVPEVVDVVFNRYIKQICKQLSDSIPSLATLVPTLLTKTEKEAEEAGRMTFERDSKGRVIKPRYQLVMSHTARRTCITLMHLSGKYTVPQMMSVSGHTKPETFFKYLKQSGDDDANSVADAAGEDGLF